MISFTAFSDELTKIADSKREKALYKAVAGESPVEIRNTDAAKEHGGAYFDTGKDSHIGISDHRFDSLAHEVGHAQNHEKIWGKLIQSVPANLAFALAPIAGAAAGIALSKGKKWPMVIPAAAVAPVLLAEALATRTGHKVLKKVRANPEEVEKYRANLRSAFSTYLLDASSALAGGAFGYIIGNAMKPA